MEVEALQVSYTVLNPHGDMNFSTFDHTPDRKLFLERYLADRALAQSSETLRLIPMTTLDYLFVTCLPWMRFTSIDHPIARNGPISIPNIAVGQFAFDAQGVRFPLAVQAHHGLVDGMHIAQLISAIQSNLSNSTIIEA